MKVRTFDLEGKTVEAEVVCGYNEGTLFKCVLPDGTRVIRHRDRLDCDKSCLDEFFKRQKDCSNGSGT